jgi:hypothetical protein
LSIEWLFVASFRCVVSLRRSEKYQKNGGSRFFLVHFARMTDHKAVEKALYALVEAASGVGIDSMGDEGEG